MTDNAVYCTNTDVGDRLCDINTSVYDYPTMSSTDAKSLLQSKVLLPHFYNLTTLRQLHVTFFQSWSALPLEFYSTVEYREVVPDMTSVSFMKVYWD